MSSGRSLPQFNLGVQGGFQGDSHKLPHYANGKNLSLGRLNVHQPSLELGFNGTRTRQCRSRVHDHNHSVTMVI
ncbi:hypothetical protein TNCV_3578221 [Trichonephila clavipes]|nr:hypothetical protein TNCV_3578221 [Trichonephila clavipes]